MKKPMTSVHVRITKELHKKIKVQAAKRGVTIGALFSELAKLA